MGTPASITNLFKNELYFARDGRGAASARSQAIRKLKLLELRIQFPVSRPAPPESWPSLPTRPIVDKFDAMLAAVPPSDQARLCLVESCTDTVSASSVQNKMRSAMDQLSLLLPTGPFLRELRPTDLLSFQISVLTIAVVASR